MNCAYGLNGEKCSLLEPEYVYSGWSSTERVILYSIIWWLVYWYMILVTRQSQEWCCRLLTFFHAIIVLFSAMSDIILNKEGFDFQTVSLSESQKEYLSIMLSYFVFDFVWINIYGNESWVIYFHHISSIIILLKVMISDMGGLGISFGVVGLELTNPYLQARWFLRTHGYHNTRIHKAVEIWFFFLFVVVRLIGGHILFYYTLKYSDPDLVMRLSLVAIYIVSLVFAWQIIGYLRKKYLRQPAAVNETPAAPNSTMPASRSITSRNSARSTPQNENTYSKNRNPEESGNDNQSNEPPKE